MSIKMKVYNRIKKNPIHFNVTFFETRHFYYLVSQISLPQHPNPPNGLQFGGGGLQQVVMNVGGQQMIVHQAPPQQQQQQQAQVVSVRTANGQIVQVTLGGSVKFMKSYVIILVYVKVQFFYH
jgi:hypothetical protein